ncbi:unnamed protein product [Somion occarium]
MEVESASRVIDGAVVLIDSVEGVEAQTKGVWRQLDRYGVRSRIMFLNKLDRPGASFRSSLLSLLSHRLHPKPMALSLPIASFDPHDYARGEPGIQGLVDLVNWEIWKWDETGAFTRHQLPTNYEKLADTKLFPPSHPILPCLVPARTNLLENLSMFSEELMETLLNLPSSPSAYLTVPASEIMPHLRKATLQNDILPILCGSAFKHIGTELLMDYIGALLPSPVDVVDAVPAPNAPLRMLAWKVSWDKRKGWMTFVRIYSGTLKRQSVVYNATRNQKERVSKLLLLYASEAEEVESLSFGSVGVILGLRFTRTGDTLVSNQQQAESSLRDIVPPPAVMSTSVLPQSHADLQPVQEALESLARTDPSVRIEVQEGQLLVHGLGSLHLEIVESRLRDEWGARFEFGKRRVSYREGLGLQDITPKPQTWDAQLAGKPVEIAIDLSIRPLTQDEEGDSLWDGNMVVDKDDKPLPLPDTYYSQQQSPLANIGRGIFNALSNSPHTFLPLSRVHVKVNGYKYPPEVPPSALAGASAVILRDQTKLAGMGPVMEPYIRLKITVGDDALGKVVKDLTEHGGEVLDLAAGTSGQEGEEEAIPYAEDGIYVPPKALSPSALATEGNTSSNYKRSVHAIAPLSRMLDYSNRLRAISGGHGVFEMSNAGFRQVSETRKTEILREIGRA